MKLELSQKQGFTLAMQTSVRLLQLNNLQLRNYLGELMTSNAVVELEYPEIDYRPGPFERQERVSDHANRSDRQQAASMEQLMEDKAAGASALRDLFLQSAALKLPKYHQRIMNYLIHSLDENGFLTESAESTAGVLQVPLEEVQKCIKLLQDMEPAGVGASNLGECLRLQLLRTAPQDKTALQIVDAHLTDMADQQYGAIAKALNTPKSQVVRSCDRIRSLNPKPLNGLSTEALTPYTMPDFYVVEEDGELRFILNDYYLPKIKVDPSYWQLIRDKQLSQADSEYIQNNYKQASDIIKFLSYRKATLQRVVEYMLTVQGDFFRLGPGHRVSLSNREVAQALLLHESTVSRAVSGKFFECKWGVFPLKSMFIRRTTANPGAAGNLDEILQKLQTLIASEPPGAAYSDHHLASLLSAEGIRIARRTVAKYRLMLGLPTASQRNAERNAPPRHP